jgi:thiamine pyrophosphokinase
MPAEAAVQRTIIVLSGGGAGPSPDTLPVAESVIAADSGLALAADLGLDVDVVVGDMDSVTPAQLRAAEQAGASVERHPPDKDATDLDLALQAAMDRGAERIVVVGGGAGRLDHLLGVATLLASPRWQPATIEWRTPESTTNVVHTTQTVATTPSDIISVIPFGGAATVTLSGTKWELQRADLEFGSTLGISNEATSTEVTLQVHAGTGLLVRTPQ